MSPKRVYVHPSQPSFDECCLLLGAEYVAALLEKENERATQLGKALVLFSSVEANRIRPSHASETWPIVFRRIVDAAVSARTYPEQAQLLGIPIIRLRISPQEANDIFAYATGSFTVIGPQSEENIASRLLARQVFIDNAPLVIDVK